MPFEVGLIYCEKHVGIMWNFLYAKCGITKKTPKTCTAIGETQSNRVKEKLIRSYTI